MTEELIRDYVRVLDVKRIANERGAMARMVRNDDEHFSGFGELYFSSINPGFIKGWYRHTKTRVLFSAPSGEIEMFFASPNGSASITFSSKQGRVIEVKPQTWYAFRAVGSTQAVMACVLDSPHSPDEVDSVPYEENKSP